MKPTDSFLLRIDFVKARFIKVSFIYKCIITELIVFLYKVEFILSTAEVCECSQMFTAV